MWLFLFYTLLFIACLIILVKACDFIVDGAAVLAKLCGVPALIIGLTIVAFGTSVPEAGVSILASARGYEEIAIATVLGSNMFNLLCIVGFSATRRPLRIGKDIRKYDYPIMILSALMVMMFSFDGNISRTEGGILLIMIFLYCIYMILRSKKRRRSGHSDPVLTPPDVRVTGEKVNSITTNPKLVAINLAVIAASGAAIYFSSRGVLASSDYYHRIYGISYEIIGMTLLSIATSIPEFVTAVRGGRRGENNIALGSIVGSNIFNSFLVLGLAAAVSPISLSKENIQDAVICFGLTTFCYLFVLNSSRIRKWHGVVFASIYIAYFVYVILR